jgi:SAM-dependent methyltransferase
MSDRKLKAELEHQSRFACSAGTDFIRNKQRFWESVLFALSRHAGSSIRGPVVEIGNGPFGAFLALDGKAEVICIDPLNKEYLRLFPHLRKTRSVSFITGNAEAGLDLPRANTVICYNALDHIENPEAVIENMLRLSSEEAVFIVGVDYYPNGILKWLMHRFRKHIDLPHPSHFTLPELEGLLGASFDILGRIPTSEFRVFKEDLPSEKGESGRGLGLPYHAGALAYRAIYPIGKALGMGGAGPSLGIKRMAVFVLRKRRRGRQ